MSGKERDIFKFDYARVRDCLRDIWAKYQINEIAAESNLGESNFSKKTRRYRDKDYYAAIFKDFSRVLKSIAYLK